MTKSTKKPALTAANTPSDNNLPSGSGLAGRGNSDFRTIADVLDTRLPLGQQQRTAQSVLGPQSAASLAELRTDVHEEHTKGHSLFLCAQCEQPVFVAQRPAATDVPRNGNAAYFKHFSNENAPPCSWRTQNLHSVGPVQYNGQQEGLAHLNLKNALAECLQRDPRFTDVQVEKRIIGKEGNWRVPDVSAVIDGKVVALDLQLATLQISTILERAGFYEDNDIHHVVLTDAVDLARLTQQAFCDMHLTRGGRIFAVDDASIAASLSTGRFQLKELTIVPRLVPGRPIHNVWQSRVVGIDARDLVKGQRYPMTYYGLQIAVRRAVWKAGIVDLRLHDLRHTAATRTLRVSNLRVVQHLLGHADITTTAKYAHAQSEDIRAALDAASPTKTPTPQHVNSTKSLKKKG